MEGILWKQYYGRNIMEGILWKEGRKEFEKKKKEADTRLLNIYMSVYL